MKKLIKKLIYPIIKEIFDELLFSQCHKSIQYRKNDKKVEILKSWFFEEILKNK